MRQYHSDICISKLRKVMSQIETVKAWSPSYNSSTVDAEQALERLYREKERLQDAYKNIATTNYNARTE